MTDPSFVVEYAALGDEHCTVEIKKWDGTSLTLTSVDSNVATKDEVEFAGLTDAADWTGTVTVTRWGKVANKAVQAYNLIVKLQDSDDTSVTYVRVDSTIANHTEGTNTFNAVLPAKNGTVTTDPAAVNVVLYTGTSVSKVTINNAYTNSDTARVTKEMEEITAGADKGDGHKAWGLPSGYKVDMTESVVVTVTAEDGVTTYQYILTSEMAQANTDASITAFYIGDYPGRHLHRYRALHDFGCG